VYLHRLEDKMVVPRFSVEIKLRSFIRIHKGLREFRDLESEDLFFFNSGREGMTFYLKGISEKRKLKVGVPLYCCRQVYQSVISSGNNLRFIDIGIDNKGYRIDFDDLKDLDALIFVHYFGVRYDKLKEIRTNFPDLMIIEDCSHLSFEKFEKNTVSDAVIFSFNFHKPIPAGIGGALLLNKELRNEGIMEHYNSLPRVTSLQSVKTLLSIFIRNYAFSPFVYSFLENYLKARRRQPWIDTSNTVHPKRISLIGKYLIGNQLHIDDDITTKYKNLPKEFILDVKSDILSYFPIFCRNEAKRNVLLEELRMRKIDAYILWENAFYNARFYGSVDMSHFHHTKNTLQCILFIPEPIFYNSKRCAQLMKIFHDHLGLAAELIVRPEDSSECQS